MEDLNICVNKGCSGYIDSNCKAVILFEACKDKQPLKAQAEPVAKLQCSDGLCVAECVDCGDQYCNVEGWKEDDWNNKRCPDCDGHLQAILFKPYPV